MHQLSHQKLLVSSQLLPHTVTQPMPPLKLTEESVLKQLALLDVNKSAGPDGLHPCLLLECRTEIVYALSKLIRLSLDSSKLPAEWKVAHIAPIHKKRKKDSEGNYQPVSITSVVVKLLEHIVNKAVIEHLDQNHFLNSSQHCFQSKRSVDTNPSSHMTILQNYWNWESLLT